MMKEKILTIGRNQQLIDWGQKHKHTNIAIT